MANTILTVLGVILVVLVIALGILYFVGRKLEARQYESQKMMEAASQQATILVIDKKKMKLKEAPLPKIIYEQTPKYLRWSKVPVVKAKVGPKVLTLIADGRVFNELPDKQTCKVKISGLYITEILSGGVLTEKEVARRHKAKEKAAKKAEKEAKKAAK